MVCICSVISIQCIYIQQKPLYVLTYILILIQLVYTRTGFTGNDANVTVCNFVSLCRHHCLRETRSSTSPTSQQGNKLYCTLLLCGRILMQCAAWNQIVIVHGRMEKRNYWLTSLLTQVRFGCFVKQYAGCFSVVFQIFFKNTFVYSLN